MTAELFGGIASEHETGRAHGAEHDAPTTAPASTPGRDGPDVLVWPVRHAVALVLAVAGLTLAASRVLRAMPGSGLAPTTVSLVILAAFVAVYAAELGIVGLVAARSGRSLAESIGMRSVEGIVPWLGGAVVAAFALRLVAALYAGTMISMRWLLPGWNSSPVKYFPRDLLGSVVLVLVVVVAAPIVEETIFRGVLLPSLAGRFGERWAVGLTAVVFSVMHLNPFSFAPILLVGWVLAMLFLRSRSLWVSIACHSTFNAIGILALLLLRGNGVV